MKENTDSPVVTSSDPCHWTFQEETLAYSLTSIAGVHSAVIEYLGSKLGENELGTGPVLTPVPLAGPMEQSTPYQVREPKRNTKNVLKINFPSFSNMEIK